MENNILIGTWAWGTGANGSKMVFGDRQDPENLKQVFDQAVELGFLRWDTAAVYGMGTCESLLGGFLKGKENIYLSTKFMPGNRYKQGELTKSFEESLERLDCSEIDLYWIHLPHNIRENLEEAIPLMKEGRLKSIGISNVSLEDVKSADDFLRQEGLRLGAVQNHFSLLRNDQQEIIDFCNANGITYYAYMVLEQGALSGHYNADHHFPSMSMRNFAFPKSKFKKIEGLLDKMATMAVKYQVDPSQIPILWAAGKGAVPIVGLTKLSHVKKLSEAIRVDLTLEEIRDLEEEARATGIRQQGVWEPQ